MEDQLPDYKFQSDIVASAMDYSYFSFTQPQLRANGLKFVVVFVHASFQLEIWISGYNRKFQSFWSKQLDIPPLSLRLTPLTQTISRAFPCRQMFAPVTRFCLR